MRDMIETEQDMAAEGAFSERQFNLVTRMARAWAKEEGDEHLFDQDRPRRFGEEGGEVFESYMTDASDLLRKSDLISLLPMAEILSRNPPRTIGAHSTLDEVEVMIGSLTAEIARIDAQIEDWKSRTNRSRDENWLRAAQRAAEAKEKILRIAHNLRMKLLRDGDMAEIVAGRDRQIAQLVTDIRSVKEKAARERGDMSFDAERSAVTSLLDLIEQRCPSLIGEAKTVARDAREKARKKRVNPHPQG